MTTLEDAHSPGASAVADALADSDHNLPTHLVDEGYSKKDENFPAIPLPHSTTTATDDLITKVLRFLATATPSTLGGIAVGLAASTYFILGQLGLLLIGAFTGVAVLIHWESRNLEVSRAIRGERGIDVLERLLKVAARDVTGPGLTQKEVEEDEQDLTAGFDDFQPQTRRALKELVDAIIRDYVKWWYSPILPADRFFPQACQKVLTSFIRSASSHLARKRPADAFRDFLTNSSSIVIVFFSEISAAYAEMPADSKVSAPDAVYNYLANYPESSLANLVSRRQQATKFKMVAEDLLVFLERPTYDCDPARAFMREILAGVILEMTLQTCSSPDWVNSWIVYLLEAGEPDFNQAIDVGMQRSPSIDNNLIDIDGNVGSIGLSKGNRNSFDAEKARRKELMGHKKQLSKADEEMELAMEDMKRMNQMIAEEQARRSKGPNDDMSPTSTAAGAQVSLEEASAQDASERLTNALNQNADETGLSANEPPESTVDKSEPLRLSTDIFTDMAGSSDAVEPLKLEESHLSQNPLPCGDTPIHSLLSNDNMQFTNFDQIVPLSQDDSEAGDNEIGSPPLVTLQNATITVLEEGGDSRMRSKPTWDYLIQIEPATTHYPGWMIVRKYSDFEPLHEILRRIAAISGAKSFAEQHKALPTWRIHTRSSLRGELERYLRDACSYSSLAESEGMKKFLEKDTKNMPNASKIGLQTFEKFGKNVFDVLASAPVEGSRAVVGGVTGVLGNMGLGPRKHTSPVTQNSGLQDVTAASRLSISTPPRMDSSLTINGARKRDSMDSQRSSVVSTQPSRIAPMERRTSYHSQGEPEIDSLQPSQNDQWDRPALSGMSSRDNSRAYSVAPLRSPSTTSLDGLRLPPPPDAMPDDFGSADAVSPHTRNGEFFAMSFARDTPTRSQTKPDLLLKTNTPSSLRPARQFAPFSEPEARVAVELVFAMINELYTLSSAWNIRRTLLAAAKSFLLRPGNPSLISIQTLIQSSVINANASDAGIAAHLRKLRENTMPTDAERAAWPAELTAPEKEKLRVKARKLLIKSGMPVALSGVMGQSATNEALGRVFDCLQVEEVSRGLMFGIMLQAVRMLTH